MVDDNSKDGVDEVEMKMMYNTARNDLGGFLNCQNM